MTTPRNARSTTKGRVYRLKGEEFASVTTILGAGYPKPALPNWAAKSVAEFVLENLGQVNALAKKDAAAALDLCKGSPWRQRDKAANVGTKLHRAAEAHVLGKPRADDVPEVEALLDAFIAWIDKTGATFEASEFTVYNRTHIYAGTADAIVVIDGVRWLVDYKTSPKGPYPDTALQLAAYRYGEFVGMPDDTEIPVPTVDRCGVLKVRPEGEGGCQLYPMRADEDTFKFFLFVRQTAYFVNNVADRVIGEPVAIDLERALERSLEAAS